MKSALIAEYRKFFSTRIWWVLLIVMVAYLGFIALALAFSSTVDLPEDQGGLAATSPIGTAQMIYSLTNPLGYVFALIVGSMAVTTEFRHKTITSSLLVEPRRGILLGAKLLAGIPMGLVYGLVATATVVIAAAPVLSLTGDGAFLSDGNTIQVLAMSVVALMLWTIMGVAFGSVVPNQVAAIVILLAFTQLVEPIARIALASVPSLSSIAQYLPGAAADALIGSSLFGSMSQESEMLSRPAGAAIMLAYIAVFAVIGRYTTLRRDI